MKFVVTTRSTTVREYLVEAENEDEARELYNPFTDEFPSDDILDVDDDMEEFDSIRAYVEPKRRKKVS